MRRLLLAPLFVLPLLLAACSEPDPAPTEDPSDSVRSTAPATAATGTAPPASTPAGSASVPSTATPRPGGDGPTAVPVRNCGAPTLKYSLVATDASAGHITYTIASTNRGAVPCRVLGAPRLFLVDQDGNQLGAGAGGGGGDEGPYVRVPPGGSAVNDLVVVDVGTDGGPLAGRCTTRRAVAIGVEAPNYGTSARLPITGYGCTEPDVEYLTATAARPGGA